MNRLTSRINLEELIALVILGLALLLSFYFHMSELSMSISSGLMGYIGGKKSKSEGDKWN